jgi:aryl-alcohol dehydrogenase-like predicted oxidoreductase
MARAATYNPILPQLEKLTDAMREIAVARQASVAQVAVAWAIAKGAVPIIGVTQVRQVQDAAAATKLELSEQDIRTLEGLAEQSGVDTRGGWERAMVS